MRCPYCLQEGNVIVCGDMYRCFNHNDIHVWFNYSKRIMGYDGYCVEICFLKMRTKLYKCPRATRECVFVVGDFDYCSHDRRYIWGVDFVDGVRPRTFKKFLHRVRTIVVFS